MVKDDKAMQKDGVWHLVNDINQPKYIMTRILGIVVILLECLFQYLTTSMKKHNLSDVLLETLIGMTFFHSTFEILKTTLREKQSKSRPSTVQQAPKSFRILCLLSIFIMFNEYIRTITYFPFQLFCSSVPTSSLSPPVTIQFKYGLPLLTVLLPSRQESCQFSLRPLSDTVGSFCRNLQQEDRGLDYVAVNVLLGGVRVALSTSIEHLLQFGGFRLRLNDNYYEVIVPSEQKDVELSSDRLPHLDDLKAKVAALHASLCVDDYKISRERKLILQLERIESELRPMQQIKLQIEKECESFAEKIMWTGFAAMGIQTGENYSWFFFMLYTSVLLTNLLMAFLFTLLHSLLMTLEILDSLKLTVIGMNPIAEHYLKVLHWIQVARANP
uniref:Calcium uniporter protein n=1 Tax=Heterorhabditis bacteriophora TaxID=37862 RepID=A0A1I7WEF5_HETBA